MGLIRLPTSIDKEKFGDALDVLKGAQHSSEYPYWKVPTIVSCKSAVEYILASSTKIQISDMRGIQLRNFPRYLLYSVDGSSIIEYGESEAGDLVFYYGSWFKNSNISCIKHMGIMINKTEFYHSTQIEGYTISNLQTKINEGKIATRGQLLLSNSNSHES